MNKKSKFLTFVFALIPGAGQMYQGRLKRGTAFMLCLAGLIALTAMTRFGAPGVFIAVLWFYTFFDCMNNINKTTDELALLDQVPLEIKDISFFKQKNLFVGVLVLLIGILMLYSTAIEPVLRDMQLWELVRVLSRLPGIIVSAAVVIIGIKFVSGPKKGEGKDE